ncbi:lysosome-associated membrane glycoprotein 1-like [Scyliorhinus canicula]|uniref:lysosome-associated membrane glycoprotein 1-like n=1 Tax=Scyliorhinus canicula TaxID=7830 RepID=UPI0018F45007|nr:lysosome-associated membrane glycoprotein 1-like [Scyliorhinus canicula]
MSFYRLLAPLLLLGFLQVALMKRFEVKDGSKVCLLAELSANFSVNYKTTAKKEATVLFSLPEDAQVSNHSNCNNMTAPLLIISFEGGHSLSMNFSRVNTSYKMDVLAISCNWSDQTHFPNASSSGYLIKSSRSMDISAKINTTYKCTSDSTVHMNNVNLTLSHVRMEAFPPNNNFSSKETKCPADLTPTAPTTTLVTTLTPTTAAPPTPQNPTTGNYNVTDSKGICLLAKMGLQLNITYATPDNKTALKVFNIQPNSTGADGNCTSDHASLQLTDGPTKLNFVFVVNATTSKFYLKELSVSIDLPAARGKAFMAKNESLNYLQTTLGKSYVCRSEQTLQVNPNFSINAFEIQVQPFRVNDSKYATAEECQMDKDNMLIPIIVGAALAGLVLIVLIAYLIGRKRSHAGYQTI